MFGLNQKKLSPDAPALMLEFSARLTHEDIALLTTEEKSRIEGMKSEHKREVA